MVVGSKVGDDGCIVERVELHVHTHAYVHVEFHALDDVTVIPHFAPDDQPEGVS